MRPNIPLEDLPRMEMELQEAMNAYRDAMPIAVRTIINHELGAHMVDNVRKFGDLANSGCMAGERLGKFQ